MLNLAVKIIDNRHKIDTQIMSLKNEMNEHCLWSETRCKNVTTNKFSMNFLLRRKRDDIILN